MGGPVRVRGEAAVRLAVWMLLIAAWAFAVWQMRQGLTDAPGGPIDDPDATLVATPRTFLAAALFSGLELTVVLVLLWPGWSWLYATRLGVGILALVTWSIMVTPSTLSRLDRVHQQWLSAMAAMLATALLALLLYRLGRWARRRGGAARTAAGP